MPLVAEQSKPVRLWLLVGIPLLVVVVATLLWTRTGGDDHQGVTLHTFTTDKPITVCAGPDGRICMQTAANGSVVPYERVRGTSWPASGRVRVTVADIPGHEYQLVLAIKPY